MASGIEGLTPDQRALLTEWFPGAVVVKDHSWGLVETTVLELTHEATRLIIKAGGPNDHHIEREVHAHLNWLRPWTPSGHAPTLLRFDTDAKLLATRYLPGDLVGETERADEPDTYRQAGQLLALLHAQPAVVDP